MALRDNAAGDIAFLLEALDETRERLVTVRHELDTARETQQSVRVAYDKLAARLDAVRTFAADWEAVRAHNREAFSRGRIGYMKAAPTLDRLRAILNGGVPGWIPAQGPMLAFVAGMDYGSPGQVLATNSTGDGLEWVTPYDGPQ